MNTDNTLETAEEYPNNAEDAGSVDDFIRELENLEQDLHITAELKIEVSESEFDDRNLPDFIVEDLKAALPKSIEPAKPNISSNETQMRLRSEIASLENTIVKFKAERQEILDRSRRQAEDFENFRNRTERERTERLSSQMENLARQMLPVLDNLNRALDFGFAMSQEKRDEIGPFFDGIMLVNQQMLDVMTEMGVQPIVAVGQDFDPHLHEAVAIDQNAELPPNSVAEEMLRGYRMGNRVIRHSMVKVTAPNATNSATNNAVDNDLPPQLT